MVMLLALALDVATPIGAASVAAGGGVVAPAERWSTMALMAAICGPAFLAYLALS